MDQWRWCGGPPNANTRDALPYMNNQNMQGIGNEAVSALGKAIAPPNVKVDTKVDVKVSLDGAAIAAAVSTRISKQNRSVNGSADYDAGMHFSPPEPPTSPPAPAAVRPSNLQVPHR